MNSSAAPALEGRVAHSIEWKGLPIALDEAAKWEGAQRRRHAYGHDRGNGVEVIFKGRLNDGLRLIG